MKYIDKINKIADKVLRGVILSDEEMKVLHDKRGVRNVSRSVNKQK